VTWLDHGRVRESGPAQKVVDSYIGSVNAEEAEPVGREVDVTAAARRPGSGEITLSSVELIGPSGNPAAACLQGDQLRLRLTFDAGSAVPQPTFQISFHHETGPVVTKVTSVATGDVVDHVRGPGRVDYVQDACQLNAGNYKVDVTVLDDTGTHIFDEWSDALTLVVRKDSGISRGGLVSLNDRFDTERARQVGEAAVADGDRP
jgi:hypothetical protein